MIEITLLGTGSPLPDPNRAGPSTLVRAGGQVFLVDCGRGVLQRAAAVGVVGRRHAKGGAVIELRGLTNNSHEDDQTVRRSPES